MQNLQSPFSFSDTNMEILNNFPQMNLNCGENIQSSFEFSHDNFLYPMPEFPGKLADNFPGFFSAHKNITVPVLPITEPVTSTENDICKGKKRRSMETLENSSANSSFPASGNAIKKKNSSARVKRLKINGKEDEKNKEVVHVRARRGQATDSHSIAERIRRGKINEKLKCLQSIVPGCYKAMGMAVMLDEIINYVHSLQSQVEFLSMKLTVASTFPEFNSEDVLENLQRVKAYEVMDGSEGVVASTHFGPNLDPNLGCYSSLAYNK